MAIIYDPKAILKRTVKLKEIKGSLNKRNLNLKREALKFADKFEFLDKSEVVDSALKAIESYQKRIEDGKIDKSELLKSPKYLINQIENNVIYQVKERIKENYSGKFYEWLPSDASEPDPKHQLLYGTIRIVGDGEMPGDRHGCRCGMRILTEDEKLIL